MGMVGHETRIDLRRYAIQDEVMLREGLLDSMRTPSNRRPKPRTSGAVNCDGSNSENLHE